MLNQAPEKRPAAGSAFHVIMFPRQEMSVNLLTNGFPFNSACDSFITHGSRQKMVRNSRLHLKLFFSRLSLSLVASQRSTAHCPINFYFSLAVVPTYLIALSSPRGTWSTAIVHERYFFLIQCSVGIWAPSLSRFFFLQLALNKLFYKLLILSVKKKNHIQCITLQVSKSYNVTTNTPFYSHIFLRIRCFQRIRCVYREAEIKCRMQLFVINRFKLQTTTIYENYTVAKKKPL